ncbi:hypothetical protein [Stenotrophomonas phage RAS14]
MELLKLLLEKKEEKPKKPKIVFVETDGREAFPVDTMTALKKEINKQAKDLELQWNGPVQLVDAVFAELNVPKPLANLKDRWEQYTQLLAVAVRALRDSRGMKSAWSQTV